MHSCVPVGATGLLSAATEAGLWLPPAEEPRLVVEGGSNAVVVAKNKYQALAEEEGHQAVAVEDLCLALAVVVTA